MAEVPPIIVYGYEYAGKPAPEFVGDPMGLALRDDDSSYLPCPSSGPYPTIEVFFPGVVPGQSMMLLTRTRRNGSGLKYIQIALQDDPYFFTEGDAGGGSLASADLPYGDGWVDMTREVVSVDSGYLPEGVLTPFGGFSMWMTVEGSGDVDLSYIALDVEPLPPPLPQISGELSDTRRRFVRP